MDSIVILDGCAKTVPIQPMGSDSSKIPAVQLVSGPMTTGRYEGKTLGACTDCRRNRASSRAGKVFQTELDHNESHCALGSANLLEHQQS